MRDKILGAILVIVIVITGNLIYQESKTLLEKQPAKEGKTVQTFPAAQAVSDFNNILQSGKIEDCAMIKNPVVRGKDYRVACTNDMALKLALDNNDLSYCGKADDKLMKISACQNEVLFKQLDDTLDIKICNGAPTAGAKASCQSYYWTKTAISKNKISLCNNAMGINGQSACKDFFNSQSLFNTPSGFDCSKFSKSLTNLCARYKTQFGHLPGNIPEGLKDTLQRRFIQIILAQLSQ